jgi:hypothetical protein
MFQKNAVGGDTEIHTVTNFCDFLFGNFRRNSLIDDRLRLTINEAKTIKESALSCDLNMRVDY